MDLTASILLFVQITEPFNSRVTRRRPRSCNVDWDRGIDQELLRVSYVNEELLGQLVYAYISYYSNRFQDVGNECGPKYNSSNFDEL